MESWSHWEQFLSYDLQEMTKVSQCDSSGWPLDVLKAASTCRIRVETPHGECDGTALEELLSEEQLPTLV